MFLMINMRQYSCNSIYFLLYFKAFHSLWWYYIIICCHKYFSYRNCQQNTKLINIRVYDKRALSTFRLAYLCCNMNSHLREVIKGLLLFLLIGCYILYYRYNKAFNLRRDLINNPKRGKNQQDRFRHSRNSLWPKLNLVSCTPHWSFKLSS